MDTRSDHRASRKVRDGSGQARTDPSSRAFAPWSGVLRVAGRYLPCFGRSTAPAFSALTLAPSHRVLNNTHRVPRAPERGAVSHLSVGKARALARTPRPLPAPTIP